MRKPKAQRKAAEECHVLEVVPGAWYSVRRKSDNCIVMGTSSKAYADAMCALIHEKPQESPVVTCPMCGTLDLRAVVVSLDGMAAVVVCRCILCNQTWTARSTPATPDIPISDGSIL